MTAGDPLDGYTPPPPVEVDGDELEWPTDPAFEVDENLDPGEPVEVDDDYSPPVDDADLAVEEANADDPGEES